MDNPVSAIVPLKALRAAKGRLAGTLDPEQRRQVVAWMFAHVIGACARAGAIDRLLVVAGDDDAAALARQHGAETMVERQGGLLRAVAAADAALAEAPATLVVAADLPLATAEDLDAVCAAGAQRPAAVVVAPTSDGGTGALLRRPPGIMSAAFGADSAARHLARAREAGVEAVRLPRPGLALDVDTADGLKIAAEQLPALAALSRR